jgi:hypothetical protein
LKPLLPSHLQVEINIRPEFSLTVFALGSLLATLAAYHEQWLLAKSHIEDLRISSILSDLHRRGETLRTQLLDAARTEDSEPLSLLIDAWRKDTMVFLSKSISPAAAEEFNASLRIPDAVYIHKHTALPKDKALILRSLELRLERLEALLSRRSV